MNGKLPYRLRVAALPVLCCLLYLTEARALLPAPRLFTFIFVCLLFAAAASLVRDKWRDGLIVLASLSLGLSLFEGAAMMWEPIRLVKVTGSLWSPHRGLGWRPGKAERAHAERIDPKSGATIYSADYTIDRNLLRRTQSCESGPAVVFFGCSFTFGDGVNDDETMPQFFADLLGRKQRTLNLGYEGYGPQQMLRAMETGLFDAVIGPQPAAFVFLTAAWHAERTACKAAFVYDGPHYAFENGAVVFKGACKDAASFWPRAWLEKSALYRVAVEPYGHRVNHEDVDHYVRIVLAAVSFAREKYGVPVLIAYMRSPDAYLKGTGFDDEAIVRRLRDGGAEVADVSLAEEEAAGAVIAFKGDGHPTPLANRLRAGLIKDYIERNMSAPPSPLQSRLD